LATTICHGWWQAARPALDDAPRFAARGGVGSLPLGIDGNVEAPYPHAHGRSIRGVEPTIQTMLDRPIR
jgi:hypothetical protein